MPRYWELPLATPPRLLQMGLSVHHPLRQWDRYQLPGLWCLHFYRYRGELRINGESFAIAPGHVSITPPGAQLEYAYHDVPSHHIHAHFRLEAHGEPVLLPAMQALENDFEPLARQFEKAVLCYRTQRRRAEAGVWELLWRLTEVETQRTPRHATQLPPPVGRALLLIEKNLSQPLSINRIAAHAGLSHNQFTRIFKAATGDTPAVYLRRRRVERARHLLEHSTLPAKAIAAQCGLGDLQAFNKAVRRELGASPRTVRRRQPDGQT